MTRIALVTLAVIAVGIVARPEQKHKHDSSLHRATRDISEKLDGKEANATAVEVTLEPGQESAAHRHPGPTFGYVLEGEYEWAIDDQPAKVLKPGETFYEPGRCL